MLEDDPDFYIPATVSFVLNVAPALLPKVKEQLVVAMSTIDSEDRIYLCHPDNEDAYRWPGEVIGGIANYIHPGEFNLREAVKNSVYVAGTHNEDAFKYVFVIQDQFADDLEYGLKRAIMVDIKERFDCQIFLYDLGKEPNQLLESVCEVHPNCKYQHFNVDSLSERVMKHYKDRGPDG